MYNDGDTINHHGFKRKVGDTKDSNTMMEFSASTYYKIAKTVGGRWNEINYCAPKNV